MPNEDVAQAEQRLTAFTQQIVPLLLPPVQNHAKITGFEPCQRA
jgi:hypothetical protein